MSSAATNKINHCVSHLEKAASAFEPRAAMRVLRALPGLRRAVDASALSQAVTKYCDEDEVATLISAIQSVGAAQAAASKGDEAHNEEADADVAMDAEDAEPEAEPQTAAADDSEDHSANGNTAADAGPLIDAFVHLLVLAWLCHSGPAGSGVNAPQQALEIARKALGRIREQKTSRRALDHLAAKIWFYYVQAASACKQAESLEPELMAGLRTATLRHNGETQAMIIVLLLQILLSCNRFAQAAILVSKTSFPANASNSLVARYYYYLARISAVQLDYSTAFGHVTGAVRKAPQTDSALGFLQTASKLSVLIELLTGDIPDRQSFKRPEMTRSLAPYLALTRAVRSGDVALFGRVLEQHAAALKADRNYTLAQRLRENVIKTGIRIVSLTYSRISLRDICLKLQLDGEESAEYVVAKAIRDGVIDAEINHVEGYMQSRETRDVYNTTIPQEAYRERVAFCLKLHDDSVKAMRYLNDAHRDELKDAEEAREREKELVTEFQESTDPEDYDADFDL